VVAGAGLGAARAGALGLGLAAVLCVLSAGIVVATAVDRDLGREDWRGLAAALGPRADGRLVAVQPPHELRSLETYLPTRPAPAAIRADRLTVVQTTRAGPQPQPPAPRGWTFVGRREVQRLSVVEYRRPAGPREPVAGPPELPGATVRLAP
jgi:hypothetical protein